MIDISSNIKEATKLLSATQKIVIPQATSTSLNKTMTTVVKEIKRDVAKDTGLKQKVIAERIKVGKSNKRTQTASLQMSGRYFNLIRFKAKQTKKGVKASAWGKRKLYRGAFIANRGHTVFTREGKKRLPVKALPGPNPAVEAKKRMDDQEFTKTVMRRFDKVFAHEVDYRLRKKLT